MFENEADGNYKRILEGEMEHPDEDRIAIDELITYFGEENLDILDSMIKKIEGYSTMVHSPVHMKYDDDLHPLETILKHSFSAFCLMHKPVEEMPLFINDKDSLVRTVAEWRLQVKL